MPLFAGICSKIQAEELKDSMMKSFRAGDYTLCASCATDEPRFEPLKYWRGPIWINVNWMLYHGLKRYGFIEEAALVRKETLDLIEKNGFYEYFDPRATTSQNEKHLGGNSFSWTAALYLDLV